VRVLERNKAEAVFALTNFINANIFGLRLG
jgi:hypothetical protein